MNNYSMQDIKNLISKAMKEEPISTFLDSKYNEVKDLVAHPQPYYKLFYYLAQELKPEVVVELGGWRGYAAAHFAAGNPDSLVISIDHHSDPGDEINQQKMIQCTQEYPNMRYVQGWTTPEYVEEYKKGKDGLPNVLKILNGKPIDILFVDSWHEGRYFMRDWNTYKKLLSKTSLVIADDLMNTELFINMEEVWEDFPGEKFINSDIHWGIPIGFSKYEY